MASRSLLQKYASLAALISGAFAGFNPSSSNNIAAYWGQDSSGATGGSLQQGLAYYCANSDIDIIPLAFLYQITTGEGGEPVIDFANEDGTCSTFSGTGLLDCPQIGADITTCQNTYGKTILLSIGGATYTEGGFSSSDAATAAAQQIWATFGPEQSGSSALRPFGSASVNGFDLDFESTVSNMVPFASELRSLMDAAGSGYYLTAAPQCPYPDAADNEMLDGAVSFDAIWVQFYNNYCGLQSFTPGSSTQTNFNFDTWDNWAKTVSANPSVKVFLGVPGNTAAAGSGYEPPSTVAEIIQYCKQFSSFGGVMTWDASQADNNSGFLAAIRTALTTAASRIMRRLYL